MTTIVLTPDGTQTTHQLPDTGSLHFLQTHVGGLVDVVAITSDLDMWVNDEGYGVLPRNLVAEAIVDTETGSLPQHYFGTVVFASHDAEGETTPLPEHWTQRIAQYRMPMYGLIMIPSTTIPRRHQ